MTQIAAEDTYSKYHTHDWPCGCTAILLGTRDSRWPNRTTCFKDGSYTRDYVIGSLSVIFKTKYNYCTYIVEKRSLCPQTAKKRANSSQLLHHKRPVYNAWFRKII